ncbi:variable large family protein [Borreliella garinii]|uniref:variable large family protein n=1 Tax=Borreliella garinii TaxID=29519 RepID=UPI003F51C703
MGNVVNANVGNVVNANVGNVVNANVGNVGIADDGSVKGIAGGMKTIVEVAKKVEGVKFEPEEAVDAADNKNAGKLFASQGNGGGADDAGNAAAAVGTVSGDQILKAIVDAAKEAGDGAGANATNPIAAAIGAADDDANRGFNNNGMKKKNDKIAAAIVLRGMAKGGKFALGNGDFDDHKSGVKSTVENAVAVGNVVNANDGGGSKADDASVKGIASGMKTIVEVAEKVEGVKFEPEAAVDAAAGDGNKDAGKLFASRDNQGGDAADAGNAAAAVGAVSGDQILKAIVDAAKEAGGGDGAQAQNAANPIAAAIGEAADNAASGFNNGGMKTKNDKIAAAIVLRGMAKGGKFALSGGAFDAHKSGVKSTVENAVAIGNIVETAGGIADGESVKRIAGGMKAIVEVAKKVEGVKFEPEEAVDATGDADNKNAGKLFASQNGQGAAAADAGKAAAAVIAVSGDQILKAIVDAAKEAGDAGGANAAAAANPIAAAIGEAGDDANRGFNNNGMKKKNDKIAAAIVLRGMAKGGKFALGAGAFAAHKSGVKSTVENAVAVGNVVEANGGSIADDKSVKGIASGMKAIVEVAEKVEGVKFEPEEAVDAADNKNAGKLFASQNNQGGGADDAGKAAAAVGTVSGDQILKAIVDAAGDGDGAGENAQDAANPIAAADNATQGFDKMKTKNDKIAAAIVLRGMAKGGKFALGAGAFANHKSGVKSTVENAVAIGNIVETAGGIADGESVKRIAGGMKTIVEVAKKVDGVKFAPEKAVDATGNGNKNAGKLFASRDNGIGGILFERLLKVSQGLLKKIKAILMVPKKYFTYLNK